MSQETPDIYIYVFTVEKSMMDKKEKSITGTVHQSAIMSGAPLLTKTSQKLVDQNMCC